MSLHDLPSLNAFLNGTSAFLVMLGLWQIRTGHKLAHGLIMGVAFLVSTAFLISYLIYHAQVGSVSFVGIGWIRPVYFTILVTHTILAVVIVPLVLRTVYLARYRRWKQHVALARWTMPIWLYVSISGIVVYWMLYRGPWTS